MTYRPDMLSSVHGSSSSSGSGENQFPSFLLQTISLLWSQEIQLLSTVQHQGQISDHRESQQNMSHQTCKGVGLIFT